MKIGFSKNGLTINSKKFDPLNLSVKGHGIESDNSITQVDPFDILLDLSSCKNAETGKLDKIKILQSAINKIK